MTDLTRAETIVCAALLPGDAYAFIGRVPRGQLESVVEAAVRVGAAEERARPTGREDRLREVVKRVSLLTVGGKDHTQFAARFPVFAGLVADAKAALSPDQENAS